MSPSFNDRSIGKRVMTGEPGFVGLRVLIRLLAVGREPRTVVRRPARAAHVSVVAADRDGDAGRLDDIAGCEFVDDRIHLVE